MAAILAYSWSFANSGSASQSRRAHSLDIYRSHKPGCSFCNRKREPDGEKGGEGGDLEGAQQVV